MLLGFRAVVLKVGGIAPWGGDATDILKTDNS